MPKNVHGGNKAKKGKNTRDDEDRKAPCAEKGQIYAKVIKRLGGNRIEIEGSDGKKYSGVIRGKFIKKVWMNAGDIVLADTEGMGQDGVCTINYKYNLKEIKELRQKGLITFESETDDMKFDETVADVKSAVKSNWMDDLMPPEDSGSDSYSEEEQQDKKSMPDITLDDL